jgi:hypothetical protein
MRRSDINYVIQTLDRLVAEKTLPPKVLVVHRFTRSWCPTRSRSARRRACRW